MLVLMDTGEMASTAAPAASPRNMQTAAELIARDEEIVELGVKLASMESRTKQLEVRGGCRAQPRSWTCRVAACQNRVNVGTGAHFAGI